MNTQFSPPNGPGLGCAPTFQDSRLHRRLCPWVKPRRWLLPLLAGSWLLSCPSWGAEPGWYPHEGGALNYRVNLRFGEEPYDTMPAGWKLGRVSSVATDASGEVYVFQRGPQADPLIVFDRQGRYLRSWGAGRFSNPHGIRIDREGSLWITDTGLHQVLKFDRQGKLLLTLGTPRQAGATAQTFNRPTDVGFAANGDFFVTDGYGNSRVVKFSAAGKYLLAWGEPGSGPGQFHLPHAVVVDASGWVYVSDRENDRIQIFDSDGKFLKQWTHLGATQGMCLTPNEDLWIITHRNHQENADFDTLSGRIMRLDKRTGKILGSIESPGHGIHVALDGKIYIASLTGNVFCWQPK